MCTYVLFRNVVCLVRDHEKNQNRGVIFESKQKYFIGKTCYYYTYLFVSKSINVWENENSILMWSKLTQRNSVFHIKFKAILGLNLQYLMMTIVVYFHVCYLHFYTHWMRIVIVSRESSFHLAILIFNFMIQSNHFSKMEWNHLCTFFMFVIQSRHYSIYFWVVK